MASTAVIQPVKIGDKIANILSCRVTNYDLDGNNCNLYWRIYDVAAGETLKEDTYIVSKEVLSNWGVDDSIIIKALVKDIGYSILSIIDNTNKLF